MDKPISSRQKKEEKVADLSAKIKDAKSIAFADYRGLTAEQIRELRSKIKDAGGELIVAKNTLLKLALTSNQLPDTDNQLTGPTAAVFAYNDEVSPIKEVAQSAKTFGLPQFKFGFLDKKMLTSSDLDSLAKIPGRDILYANVVGSLASPIHGIVEVLSANIKNLVSVLDQASKKASS